jgi:lipoyl(octanoyl) transferase
MIWRLILDGAATGAWNMAVDEALLLSRGDSTPDAARCPPTLRFYDWQPPCLSLGRFQDFNEVLLGNVITDETASRIPHPASRMDIVRRPTGGRAVWHHLEITYSAVLHESDLPPHARSVLGAYRWLSEGFIAGLRMLGVNATLDTAPQDGGGAREGVAGANGKPRHGAAREPRTPNCFSSTTRCDFVVDGRKLIGAAQCRKHGAILQHGSLLLDVDERAWKQAIGGSMRDTVTLKSLGITCDKAAIIAALCGGVEYSLGASLSRGALQDEELALARRLHARKYSQRDWNAAAVAPRHLVQPFAGNGEHGIITAPRDGGDHAVIGNASD